MEHSFEVYLLQWLLQDKDHSQQFTATHLPLLPACSSWAPTFLCHLVFVLTLVSKA